MDFRRKITAIFYKLETVQVINYSLILLQLAVNTSLFNRYVLRKVLAFNFRLQAGSKSSWVFSNPFKKAHSF